VTEKWRRDSARGIKRRKCSWLVNISRNDYCFANQTPQWTSEEADRGIRGERHLKKEMWRARKRSSTRQKLD